MIAVSQPKRLEMVNQAGKVLFFPKAAQDFHPFSKSSYVSQSQPEQNRLDEKTKNSYMESDTKMSDGKKRSVKTLFDFIRKAYEIKKETEGLVGIEAQRSIETQQVLRDKVKGEIPSSAADIYEFFTPKITKDGDNKVKVFLQRISFPGMKRKIELCVANTQDARNSKLLKNDYNTKQEMDPLPTPGLIFDWSEPPVFPEYKPYIEDNFQLKIPNGDEIPIKMLRIVSSVDAKPIEPPQYLLDICPTENNPAGHSSENLNKLLSSANLYNPPQQENKPTKSDVPVVTISDDDSYLNDSFLKLMFDDIIDLDFNSEWRKDLATPKKKRYKKFYTWSYKKFLQILSNLPAVSENVPDKIFADEDSEMEIEQEDLELSPIKIKHEIRRTRVSSSTEGATYLRPNVYNYHPFHDHWYCPNPWPGLPEVVEDVGEVVDVLTVTNEMDEEAVQIQRKRGRKRGPQARNATVPVAAVVRQPVRRAVVRQPVRRAIVRQPVRRVILREPVRRMPVPFPKTHKTWASNSKKTAKLVAFKSRPNSGALRCKVDDAAKRKEHNIAERGRRANLKEHLENLKKLVPGVREKPKAATIDILISASEYIKKLKECDIDLLRNRNNYLTHKLKQLKSSFLK